MHKFILLLLVLSISTADAQSVTPGTYRVWLCETTCTKQDSARAVAQGIVVIFDDSAAATEPIATALANLRKIRTAGAGVINACFRVTRRQRTVGGEELFFGIVASAATRVRRADGAGFVLPTYASPDAFYDLKWQDSGLLSSGTGWSAGWEPSNGYHRNAFFVAERIDQPQVAQCVH